jgi:drug/metabolite transporter (DMT)-like permease
VTPRQWLAFAFVAVTWGTTFFWYKLALRELPPHAVLLYRTGLGTLALGAAAVWLRPGWRAPARAWLTMVLFGVGNLAFPQWLIIWSEQYVDSGMTAVMLAMTPLLTLLAAQLVLADEPVTGRRLVAIALGLAGVVLLMSRSLRVGQFPAIGAALLGQLAQLGAAGCFAVTSVMVRHLGAGMAPLPQAAVAAASATAFAALLGAGPRGRFAVPVEPLTWGALIALGVVINGMAWLFFLSLLGSVGPIQTQMISYLVPLVAVVLGVAALGEPLRPELAGGGALVLAAIALSHRAQSRGAAKAPRGEPEASY